jgi:hypothetical protein
MMSHFPELEYAIRKRFESDRMMGYIWMIVPILPLLLAILGAAILLGFILRVIAAGISGPTPTAPFPTDSMAAILMLGWIGLILVGFIISVFGAVALYYMISRRNNHFRRQRMFTSILLPYLEVKLKEKGRSPNTISALALLNRDSEYEETEKSPAVWAVLYLFVSPIVGLYVFHFLTHDLYKHFKRQVDLGRSLEASLKDLDIQFVSPAQYEIKRRETILYIILTIITVGLFWIYWFYLQLKEYNEHFKSQWKLEDQLMNTLRTQMEGLPPETHGPALPTAPQAPSHVGLKYCQYCGKAILLDAKFCDLCGKQQPA